MKFKTPYIFCLCMGITLQFSHAASVNSVQSKKITPLNKSSLIEKALTDKKLKNTESCNNQSNIVKHHTLAPTQAFFSNQNQHFSKLIQAILPQSRARL